MRKLILLIIILILTLSLSGCYSIYNLSLFTLPNDVEFLTLIQKLDTPEKICQYIEDNFTYKENSLYNPSPYQLWLQKKGDCNDFATFAIFVANYHNYITYQIHIYSDGIVAKHVIPVFVENSCLSFFSFPFYFFGFNTFSEIIDFHEEYIEWLKYIIYDYDMNIVEQVTK